jgi:hypothetical protein
MERVPDGGGFWVAWQDDRSNPKDGEDLFIRHLDPQLNPDGDHELRATDYGSPEKGKPSPTVDVPSVAFTHGNMFIAYTIEKSDKAKKPLVVRMRIPLSAAGLKTGLDEKPPIAPQPGNAPEKRKDRELDDVQVVNEDKSGTPENAQMVCNKEGCFIVWHEKEGGAQAAMIDPEKGLVIWRRVLTKTGGHPSVAVSPIDGTVQVAFYENVRPVGNRIRVATLAKDLRWNPQTFARVSSGDLPRPWLSGGRAKGEWYVAWQDWETGHTEVYTARLVCQ